METLLPLHGIIVLKSQVKSIAFLHAWCCVNELLNISFSSSNFSESPLWKSTSSFSVNSVLSISSVQVEGMLLVKIHTSFAKSLNAEMQLKF